MGDHDDTKTTASSDTKRSDVLDEKQADKDHMANEDTHTEDLTKKPSHSDATKGDIGDYDKNQLADQKSTDNLHKKRSRTDDREVEEIQAKVSKTKDGESISRAVADHYNARPQQGVERRKLSPIKHLRSFNNWVKAILVNMYTRRYDKVMDLCCGKGGDLLKWEKARIEYLFGADIAAVSIEHAKERYESGRKQFPARFMALDCFSVRLRDHLELPKESNFNVASCQFALHYSFETEQKARQFLQNVAENLQDGGIFFGTMPDANKIVSQIQKTNDLHFGNSIYQIRFEKKEFPKYGAKYWFQLEDAIDDCPEYLVHFPTLEKLAAEYGLVRLMKQGFHEFYQDKIKDRQYYDLLYRMRVLDEHGSIPAEEWEATGIYLIFAFKKKIN